jgi:hypothetical protein
MSANEQYFAMTHEDIWNLGIHVNWEAAEAEAIDKLNIHWAPQSYIVLSRRELVNQAKHILQLTGEGVF